VSCFDYSYSDIILHKYYITPLNEFLGLAKERAWGRRKQEWAFGKPVELGKKAKRYEVDVKSIRDKPLAVEQIFRENELFEKCR